MAKDKKREASRSAFSSKPFLSGARGLVIRLLIAFSIGVLPFIVVSFMQVRTAIKESSHIERLERSLPQIPEGVRVFQNPDDLAASKPVAGDKVWVSGFVWKVKRDPSTVFIWGMSGTNAMDLELLRKFNSIQCLPTLNPEALQNNQVYTLGGEVQAVTPKDRGGALYIELTNCTVFSAG